MVRHLLHWPGIALYKHFSIQPPYYLPEEVRPTIALILLLTATAIIKRLLVSVKLKNNFQTPRHSVYASSEAVVVV